VRRLFVLGLLLSGCTMDFDAFDPLAGEVAETGPDATPSPDATSSRDATSSPDAGSDDGPGQPGDDAGDDSSTSDDAGDAAFDAMPIDATTDGSVVCTESGAVTFGGHCYFALGTSGAWDAADAACTAVGAHLVTITSGAEENAITAISSGVDRWVGLSKKSSDPEQDSSFKWVTGEGRGGYQNWSSGKPKGGGDCARMKPVAGDWGDDKCTRQLDAICERE
jgi:hypothetical protein